MSNPGFRITTIHAITAVGDDDEEGVPAVMSPVGPLPLIAADERRLAQITHMAQQEADATGMTFKIVRFTLREDIGEIVPKRQS